MLNILTHEEIKEITVKFTKTTDADVWLVNMKGKVLYSQESDEPNQVETDHLFDKNSSDKVFLPDVFEQLIERSNRENLALTDWLIGTVLPNGNIVWAFPIAYFNDKMGFLMMTGLMPDAQVLRGDQQKISECLYLHGDIKPLFEHAKKGMEGFSLEKLTHRLEAFAMVGEDVVIRFHYKRLDQLQGTVIKKLKQAHEYYYAEPPLVQDKTRTGTEQELYTHSQEWVSKVYHNLCVTIKESMNVAHFGILLAHSARNRLTLRGSSMEEKEKKEEYSLDKKGTKKSLSTKAFESFCSKGNLDSMAHLKVILKNNIENSEPGAEILKDLLGEIPDRGLWAPMLIQGRCVGLLRLLMFPGSMPLRDFHKRLFSSFCNDLNEYLETVVSQYRERMMSLLPLLLSMNTYSPGFSSTENKFYEIAQCVTKLVNCRAALIRIKTYPYDEQRFQLVGLSDLLVNKYEDRPELISRVAIQEKRSWYLFENLYDVDEIKGQLTKDPQKYDIDDDDMNQRVELFKSLRVKALLSVPIRDENNSVIGLLNAFQGDNITFSEHDIDGMLEIAAQISSFLQIRRLNYRVKKRKEAETEARKFYENLSVVLNKSTTESELYQTIDSDTAQIQKYFEPLLIWRCDALPCFPFMEQVYRAKELKNKDHDAFKREIESLVRQLKLVMGILEHKGNEGDEAAQAQFEEIRAWLEEDLSYHPEKTDEFYKELQSRLDNVSMDVGDEPQNILFPSPEKRYYRVKEILHKVSHRFLGSNTFTYRFSPCNSDVGSFEVSGGKVLQYLKDLKVSLSNNPHYLLPFPHDNFTWKVSPLHEDVRATWIPLASEDCKEIYGLVRFIPLGLEPKLLEAQDEEDFLKNLMRFLSRLLSTRLERIWQSQRDHAVVELGEIFDLDKDPVTFFRESAEKIRERLHAEATLILGTQSLERDALICRGYAGFKSPGRESEGFNDYLADYVHNELKTTSHSAFKNKKAVRLDNIRCHHFCRIKYLQGLEEQKIDRKKLRNYCAVPIHHAGETIGLVEVFNKKSGGDNNHFTLQDQNLLEALAEKLGQGLSNYELVREADAQMATIVHGCRSPLQVVGGWGDFTQFLLGEIPNKLKKQAPEFEDLESIPSHIKNAVGLAELFVETTMREIRSKYEKLEAQNRVPIHLFETIDSVSRLWEKQMENENKHYLFAKENLQALPTFLAEKTDMQLLFGNIIENAIKYSDEGSEIRLDGELDGNFIQITVINVGPQAYADEEERQNLFRSFYRGKKAQKGKGSGMGLALCKKIVHNYFGQILITCEAGPNANDEKTAGYVNTLEIRLPKHGRRIVG